MCEKSNPNLQRWQGLTRASTVAAGSITNWHLTELPPCFSLDHEAEEGRLSNFKGSSLIVWFEGRRGLVLAAWNIEALVIGILAGFVDSPTNCAMTVWSLHIASVVSPTLLDIVRLSCVSLGA